MNIKKLKAELDDQRIQLAALEVAAHVITGMINMPASGTYLIFEYGLTKLIKVIPEEFEDKREMQDFLLDRIRKELQKLEDYILQERMRENNV